MSRHTWFALLLTTAAIVRAEDIDIAARNTRGMELEQKGQYREAEAEFRSALAACRETGCDLLSELLNNLGSLDYATGRYQVAEAELHEALALTPSASVLANLAAVYRAEARYAEAAPLYERALKLRQADPARDLEIPNLQAKIALLAQDMGDLPRAEKLMREALSAIEAQGAIETADGAKALTDFAAILESQAKAGEARERLQRALAIRLRLFSPDDPVIADTLTKLGQAYRLENRLPQAEQVYRQALSIERPQGPSLGLAETLNNLGTVLTAQRRWKDAEASLREAIAIWEKLLGPEHPDVAAGMANLAAVLESRHRDDEAGQLIARSLEIDEKRLPPGHPRIGQDLSNAATLAFRHKQYAKAEELWLAAAAILQKSLPAAHPQTGTVLVNLAEVYRTQKRWADSARMYKRGVDIFVQAWGRDDERLLVWLEHYASVLRMEQEFAEAGKVDIETTRIRTIHAMGRS